ncbi:MAG TPA: dienelactone hydrolase family protein [Myxococcaceae bacterium]|nr:dienelactone hydrolase family protein [Myxococcaceae bacterium]
MSWRTLASPTPLLVLGWALSTLGAEPAHDHGGDAGSAIPANQPHPVDPNPPKPQGSMITLLHPAGVSAQAYVARPKQGVRGAILVIHEWWGLNDWVKVNADGFAAQGYLALAVDLYGGKVATTKEEAGKLMQGLDAAHAAAVEKAGVQWLKQAAPGKKVATIGWCMGGGQSLLASLNSAPDVSATVIYYGLPVTDVARLKTLRGPVLGIWAKKDGWITPEKVAAFDRALTEAGVKHSFHSFDADHAFANPSGGAYNPPAAEEANALTKKFLADTLP